MKFVLISLAQRNHSERAKGRQNEIIKDSSPQVGKMVIFKPKDHLILPHKLQNLYGRCDKRNFNQGNIKSLYLD